MSKLISAEARVRRSSPHCVCADAPSAAPRGQRRDSHAPHSHAPHDRSLGDSSPVIP